MFYGCILAANSNLAFHSSLAEQFSFFMASIGSSQDTSNILVNVWVKFIEFKIAHSFIVP